MSDTNERIQDVFSSAGATGFLHATEIGGDGTNDVALGADEPVVLASVFKITVAVAYARLLSAGLLTATDRTRVTAQYRIGGTATAGCLDDVEMSWRDLALFMMTFSDNAATDVIYDRVGKHGVDQVLHDLGLSGTRIIGSCQDLFDTIEVDLGIEVKGSDMGHNLSSMDPALMWNASVLDPARTSASTPRETTRLLDAIWTDRAGSPAACGTVRDLMAQQIWPHRLTAGFDSDVNLAAKTGTMPAIRNEAGVVTYPDGRQYAVAVFTRADTLTERQPAIDRAIGTSARLAIDHLRIA